MPDLIGFDDQPKPKKPKDKKLYYLMAAGMSGLIVGGFILFRQPAKQPFKPPISYKMESSYFCFSQYKADPAIFYRLFTNQADNQLTGGLVIRGQGTANMSGEVDEFGGLRLTVVQETKGSSPLDNIKIPFLSQSSVRVFKHSGVVKQLAKIQSISGLIRESLPDDQPPTQPVEFHCSSGSVPAYWDMN
jgi:hypothetical protein